MACPPLDDPHFDRSVIAVLEHNENGAIGVVLNRPAGEHYPDGLESWMDLAAQPAEVFAGGPVEHDALLAIGGDELAWENVDLELPAADHVARVRVFRGYAGWSPGQLEAELDDGAWMVFDASAADIFTPNPDDLWRLVLRRQGGRIAWIATAPDHLSMN